MLVQGLERLLHRTVMRPVMAGKRNGPPAAMIKLFARFPRLSYFPARLLGQDAWKSFPVADHVHFYGVYIGNYPTLDRDRILRLCELLNGIPAGRGI